MNPGQKFPVHHRRNPQPSQAARRQRQVRGYPWNAIAAALNDIETVRLIRAYLNKAKSEAA